MAGSQIGAEVTLTAALALFANTPIAFAHSLLDHKPAAGAEGRMAYSYNQLA